MSMPRYFLFAYPQYYASGGFHDLVFTSDSLQECKDFFEANLLADTRVIKNAYGEETYGDWWRGHIVDSDLNMTPILFVEVEYEKKLHDAQPVKITWSETFNPD